MFFRFFMAYSQANKALSLEMPPLSVCSRIPVPYRLVCVHSREYFCSSFSEGSFSPGRITPDTISLLSCCQWEIFWSFHYPASCLSLPVFRIQLVRTYEPVVFIYKWLYKLSRDFFIDFSKTPRGTQTMWTVTVHPLRKLPISDWFQHHFGSAFSIP